MKPVFITIAVVALALGLFVLSGPMIGTYFQQQYVKTAYHPEKLETVDIEGAPDAHRIEAVPWISYEKWYCHTTALQMATRAYGIEPSIDELNFLSGFTYGAFSPGDQSTFMDYNDPIAGTDIACRHLGLKARYLTTHNTDDFLAGLRRALSQDQPVVIQLNAALLWEEDGFFPHTELLVGYDPSGFVYFETATVDRNLTDADGIQIDKDILLEAVRDLNETFSRPWRYAFIVLEPCEKISDLTDVWRRNGEALVGSIQGPVANGAAAIRRFADQIKEDGRITNPWALETLPYTRADNAAFLEERFAEDEDVLKAAELLAKAGAHYQQVSAIAGDGDALSEESVENVLSLLNQGATLEEQAGEIFLDLGKQ
jgi:hypothetical protein